MPSSSAAKRAAYAANPEPKKAAVAAWQAANPEKVAGYARVKQLRKYGLTPEDYDRMLVDQDGGCGICHATVGDGRGYRLHVDHDSDTGAVRGLLCGDCNRALGLFNHSGTTIRRAIAYLRGEL